MQKGILRSIVIHNINMYNFGIFHQQYISKIKGILYTRHRTEMSIFWMSINDALSVSWTINFGLFYCHI